MGARFEESIEYQAGLLSAFKKTTQALFVAARRLATRTGLNCLLQGGWKFGEPRFALDSSEGCLSIRSVVGPGAVHHHCACGEDAMV